MSRWIEFPDVNERWCMVCQNYEPDCVCEEDDEPDWDDPYFEVGGEA